MPNVRPVVRASALLFTLAAIACSSHQPPPMDRPPVRIEIGLDANGIVIPESVEVEQGAPFIWSSDYTFAIDVVRGDELFGQKLPPAALRGRANAPVQVHAGPNAPTGSYKYSVAVWDGTDLWVLDPEILITPRMF